VVYNQSLTNFHELQGTGGHLDIESKLHDIAFLHDVVLSLQPQQALIASGG
jgi:hypothetical protein